MPVRLGMTTRVAARAESTFADHGTAEFLVPTDSAFDQQYANMYFCRLMELRKSVEAAATQRWGAEVLQQRVKMLDAEPGVPSLIVGTIYREMQRKPNIMKEMNRDALDSVMAPEEAATTNDKYCGEGDTMLIEDESGRIALQLSAAVAAEAPALVTGIVIGVTGTLNEHGEFHADGLVMPGLGPQAPLATAGAGSTRDARYVALVSGLRVGHDAAEMLPLQLLAEHLTGQLGCDEDVRLRARS